MIDTQPREPFGTRLQRHWSELIRLAWPVVLSRAGILLLALTDFIMVGSYAAHELAWLGMGYAISVPIMLIGIGGCVGIVAEASRHTGAGRPDEAAATLRRGIVLAVLLSALLVIPHLLAPQFLHLIGHEPELADRGGRIAQILAGSSFCQVIFVALAFYLEGTKRMFPGLIAMAVANIVNVSLNWLLISGQMGMPELGVDGAAIGSVIARVCAVLILIAIVLRTPAIRALPRSGIWGPGGWVAGRTLRIIGIASAAAYSFETIGFAALTQVAGFISPQALAAYSIGHQIEATIFMVALGFSVATAVRVGNARGEGRLDEARFAGWSGLAATVIAVLLCDVLLLSYPETVAGGFTNDPTYLAAVTAIFGILAVSLVFDGAQVVLAQCNRALGDGWTTTFMLFVGFWVVMIPLGIWLSMFAGFGTRGLFMATACGALTACVLLGLRFKTLISRAQFA